MINIYCDKCISIRGAQLNLRNEGKVIIVTCSICKDTKVLQDEEARA